ncbi:hypothetical protein [Neisseria sp. CCUG12390]|uniref:hypothetical protein n=1 Tax=Neisseria sp. CCUG12390 TaxID=3392035 RepID=UPI003A0FE6E1
MDKETSLLDMADAQILGFVSHRNGDSLADLVTAMGLTPQEWEILKTDYTTTAYLSEADMLEIDAALQDR